MGSEELSWALIQAGDEIYKCPVAGVFRRLGEWLTRSFEGENGTGQERKNTRDPIHEKSVGFSD